MRARDSGKIRLGGLREESALTKDIWESTYFVLDVIMRMVWEWLRRRLEGEQVSLTHPTKEEKGGL